MITTAGRSSHIHLDRIIRDAIALGGVRVAVAHPCNATSLEAAITAARLGLIRPVLVGPAPRICEIAARAYLNHHGLANGRIRPEHRRVANTALIQRHPRVGMLNYYYRAAG